MPRGLVICVLLLAGCGGSAKPRSLYSGPGRSPAKQAYLAHFAGACHGADQASASTDRAIRGLLSRIGRGDRRAPGELSRYLRALAGGYSSGITQARRLGMPPDPGSSFALAYFAAAGRAALVLTAIADAIDNGQAQQIGAQITRLGGETRAAADASRAYGFPQCGVVGPAA